MCKEKDRGYTIVMALPVLRITSFCSSIFSCMLCSLSTLLTKRARTCEETARQLLYTTYVSATVKAVSS
jgi:hypothetical protein